MDASLKPPNKLIRKGQRRRKSFVFYPFSSIFLNTSVSFFVPFMFLRGISSSLVLCFVNKKFYIIFLAEY